MIVVKKSLLINEDSFGNICPINWDEVADDLNAIVIGRLERIVGAREDGDEFVSDNTVRETVNEVWDEWVSFLNFEMDDTEANDKGYYKVALPVYDD